MACTDSFGEVWRSDILRGVTKIPHTGAVPGTLLVWGHSARPILNSAAHGKPVVIAAAELGQGRVVVLAHESLLSASRELSQNIDRWLMKGERHDKHIVKENSKNSAIKLGDVIVWKGAKSTGDVTKEAVVNHLLRGGGLIHAICPWGWLQLNKDKRLSDMPLAEVLDIIGICYTEKYGSIPKDGLDIELNRSMENNHIVLALHRVLKDVEYLSDDDDDDDADSDNDDLPILDFSSIPLEVCNTTLCPELRRMAEILDCDIRHPEVKGNTVLVKKLTPQHDNPIKSNKSRVLIDILNKMAHLELVSLPGIENFLGCLPSGVEKCCRNVKISSTLKDIHPTGFYLDKDSTLILRLKGSFSEGWSVRIGAHSDNLTRLRQPLRRWPQLMTKADIKQMETRLYSPYGGLVYLESPNSQSEIEVCLENVVEAPIFNISEPECVQSWKQRRHAPGPWADVMGKRLMITLPSSSVRGIDDLSEVMQVWDRVISGYHELRGTDADKHRRQWIVTDEQPVAGYMHSGYPIVTHMDVAQPETDRFLLNQHVLLAKGRWGVFHEIGHNMQRPAWTFDGTGEVTCNIFTLYAMDTVSKQAVWIHEWLEKNLQKVEKYIDSEQSFAVWKSEPGVALFIYAQLVHHFGWDVYKKVFREYEENLVQLNSATDQVKMDTWFVKMSTACGYNLAPLFDFWRIPISQESIDSLQHLQACLPSDEVIDRYTGYANSLRDKYNIP